MIRKREDALCNARSDAKTIPENLCDNVDSTVSQDSSSSKIESLTQVITTGQLEQIDTENASLNTVWSLFVSISVNLKIFVRQQIRVGETISVRDHRGHVYRAKAIAINRGLVKVIENETSFAQFEL